MVLVVLGVVLVVLEVVLVVLDLSWRSWTFTEASEVWVWVDWTPLKNEPFEVLETLWSTVFMLLVVSQVSEL